MATNEIAHGENSSRSSTDQEPLEEPEGVLGDENPWKEMGFHHFTYEDAVCQHPSEVRRAFHALSRKHHPDKQTFATEEEKANATAKMQRILAAKSIILVEQVDANTGLPVKGTAAQQMRLDSAQRFLKPNSSSSRPMRSRRPTR